LTIFIFGNAIRDYGIEHLLHSSEIHEFVLNFKRYPRVLILSKINLFLESESILKLFHCLSKYQLHFDLIGRSQITSRFRGEGLVREFMTIQKHNFSFFEKFVARGEEGQKSRFLRNVICETTPRAFLNFRFKIISNTNFNLEGGSGPSRYATV